MILLFPLMITGLFILTVIPTPSFEIGVSMPPEIPMKNIPSCRTAGCRTFAYSPSDNPDVDQIMKLVMERNGISTNDYISLSDENALFYFLANHTDVSTAGERTKKKKNFF